ncbi:hypothetical protein EXIGLDRAFT_650194, partial [Exidia glandulosa HHB12029]
MVRIALVAAVAAFVLSVAAAPLNGTAVEEDFDLEFADYATESTGAGIEARATNVKGKATWFNVGLGSCGVQNSDKDPVVAITPALMGAKKTHCGQWLKIYNPKTKKSAYGRVRDTCPGCASHSKYSIDLSPSLFSKIGNKNSGIIDVTWHWMPKGFNP